MTSLTNPRPARKPRSKPARSVRWLSRPTPERIGSLQITTGCMTIGYWARLLPCDFGQAAFEVTNWLNDETYNVLLDGDRSHCECLGYLRWQKPCKHISALQALLAAN